MDVAFFLSVTRRSSSAAAAEWLFLCWPKEKVTKKKWPPRQINPATGEAFGIFRLAILGSVGKRRASMPAALRVWRVHGGFQKAMRRAFSGRWSMGFRRRNKEGEAGPYNAPMSLRPYLGTLPTLGERVYLDPACTVIGDVVLGDDVSVWPGTVIRGDVNFIRIGARTNLQDGAVVHVSHDGPHAKLGGFATRIGSDVTIGHKAIVHACTIEDAVLIGMGAIVLDGVVVKKHGFVGAGALVPPGKVVGEGEMWLGNPARKVRMLTDAEIESLYYSAQHYVRLKDRYLGGA
ncbi:MAG: gamma carbonic anhydrase family protein [Microvirga sp.]